MIPAPDYLDPDDPDHGITDDEIIVQAQDLPDPHVLREQRAAGLSVAAIARTYGVNRETAFVHMYRPSTGGSTIRNGRRAALAPHTSDARNSRRPKTPRNDREGAAQPPRMGTPMMHQWATDRTADDEEQWHLIPASQEPGDGLKAACGQDFTMPAGGFQVSSPGRFPIGVPAYLIHCGKPQVADTWPVSAKD
jgi:hypothetical protein